MTLVPHQIHWQFFGPAAATATAARARACVCTRGFAVAAVIIIELAESGP